MHSVLLFLQYLQNYEFEEAELDLKLGVIQQPLHKDTFYNTTISNSELHLYEDKTIDDFSQTLVENTKESCFIATAVYGSYDHFDVATLRKFSDNILKPLILGRALIEFYYCFGPAWAEKFSHHNKTKRVVHTVLQKIVTGLKQVKG